MARQRKLSPERKAFINSLLEHCQPSDANDVQEMLKELLGDTQQGMLEVEMDENSVTPSTTIKTNRQMTAGMVTARKQSLILSERLTLIFHVTERVSLNLRLSKRTRLTSLTSKIKSCPCMQKE